MVRTRPCSVLLGNQGLEFFLVHASQPEGTPGPASGLPGPTLGAPGGAAGWWGPGWGERSKSRLSGRRPAARELPARHRYPVGQLAQGREDKRVGDAFRAQAGAQIDRVDQGDAALTPVLAFLQEIFALQVDGPAGPGDVLVGGIEQDDGEEFAGFDQFIGAAVDEFVEDRFEAFRGIAPRNRMPRMMALRVLAMSLERLRRSVLAASLTRRCSSTCQPRTRTQTAARSP